MKGKSDLLHTFYLAGQHNSLSFTAGLLNSSRQTVKRSIDKLESELGIKLFERCNNGVTLTQAGELLWHEYRVTHFGLARVASKIRSEKAASESGTTNIQLALMNDKVRIAVDSLEIASFASQVIDSPYTKYTSDDATIAVTQQEKLFKFVEYGEFDLGLVTLADGQVASQVIRPPLRHISIVNSNRLGRVVMVFNPNIDHDGLHQHMIRAVCNYTKKMATD